MREILQNSVSLGTRVGFVEQFEELRVLFPLSNLQWFVHRLPVNAFKPQLFRIVAQINCLFLALPHSCLLVLVGLTSSDGGGGGGSRCVTSSHDSGMSVLQISICYTVRQRDTKRIRVLSEIVIVIVN
jgi:hypothetical protein